MPLKIRGVMTVVEEVLAVGGASRGRASAAARLRENIAAWQMLWKWSLLKVDHGVFFLCLGSSSKFNQDAAGGLPSDLRSPGP